MRDLRELSFLKKVNMRRKVDGRRSGFSSSHGPTLIISQYDSGYVPFSSRFFRDFHFRFHYTMQSGMEKETLRSASWSAEPTSMQRMWEFTAINLNWIWISLYSTLYLLVDESFIRSEDLFEWEALSNHFLFFVFSLTCFVSQKDVCHIWIHFHEFDCVIVLGSTLCNRILSLFLNGDENWILNLFEKERETFR